MSGHAYTEDQLVEQPAIGLFAELGWQVAGPPPTAGVAGEPRDAGLLGRETKGEVVLVPRLRAALEKLNPTLPPEAIAAAIDELTRDRSAMLLEQANREVYRLLKEGIPVSVPDPLRGGQRAERVRVIDWEQPANNDFLLVSQFSVTGALYTCRPDLVGFVNGLPLVVIELKKPGVPARAAFDENLTSYKHPQNGIPSLFVFNALLIASNGTDSRVGSLTADWERFFEWKRIEREDEPRRVEERAEVGDGRAEELAGLAQDDVAGGRGKLALQHAAEDAVAHLHVAGRGGVELEFDFAIMFAAPVDEDGLGELERILRRGIHLQAHGSRLLSINRNHGQARVRRDEREGTTAEHLRRLRHAREDAVHPQRRGQGEGRVGHMDDGHDGAAVVDEHGLGFPEPVARADEHGLLRGDGDIDAVAEELGEHEVHVHRRVLADFLRQLARFRGELPDALAQPRGLRLQLVLLLPHGGDFLF